MRRLTARFHARSLSGLCSRGFRGVFLSGAVFVSQLPSETGVADSALGEPGSLRARAAPAVCLHHSQAELFSLRASAPSAKQARKRWAALIQQVYEIDPLSCPRCGAEMKIISFIERHQREVIEKLQCAQRTSHFGH